MSEHINQLGTYVGKRPGHCDATDGCVRGWHHHGSHQGSGKLGRRWGYTWCAASRLPVDQCAECRADDETEIERLRAGGELRPGQREPDWLRELKRSWREVTP